MQASQLKKRSFKNIIIPQNANNSQYPAVQKNVWQEWDAFHGFWIAENMTLPGFSNGFTLENLLTLSQYKNARIFDTAGGGHDGFDIRFTVDIEDGNFANFQGYVDAFTIKRRQDENRVIFDFVVDQPEDDGDQ